MNIDLVELRRKKLPDNKNKLNDDCYFYINIAHRIIHKVAPFLLNSEDCVSNVTTLIMFADLNWNGMGTLEGYRKQCAVWAIKECLTRKTRLSAKPPVVSIYNINNNEQELIDFIPANKNNMPNKDIEKQEQDKKNKNLVSKMLELDTLTEIQKDTIRMHYLENLTFQEISKQINLSKERVRQIIKKGIQSIRESFGCWDEDSINDLG